jgi:hypothetical protein
LTPTLQFVWVEFEGADVPLAAIRVPPGTVAFLPGYLIDNRLADPVSFRGVDCELVTGLLPAGSILKVYTLEILSLMCDLLVGATALYLKVIVALVVPGAVVLYVMPDSFGLNIGDCPPDLSVTSWPLHVAGNA